MNGVRCLFCVGGRIEDTCREESIDESSELCESVKPMKYRKLHDKSKKKRIDECRTFLNIKHNFLRIIKRHHGIGYLLSNPICFKGGI